MEQPVAQLAVEGEVPPGMIPQQLHRPTVRDSVQKLKDAHAQEQHRLDCHPSYRCAVRLLQLGTHFHQLRENQFGKEPVTIIRWEQALPECGGGEGRTLGGKTRQAHRGVGKIILAICLGYEIA